MVVHMASSSELCRMVRAVDPVAVLVPDVASAVLLRSGVGDGAPATVVVAGMHERVDRKAADEAGVARVLSKPLRQRQLAGALMHIIEPSVQETQVQAPGGGLEPDEMLAGRRVLVVEDNPVNRRVAVAFLDKLGCSTETAEDGLAALELLSGPDQRFDLVLMDCHMPTLDGFACTRVIRSRQEAGSLSPVPIIALTANTMADDVTECIDAGMDDHLGKPFTGEQLRAKLLQWLGEERVHAEW
jgi:CheY-like chemotaxis protein